MSEPTRLKAIAAGVFPGSLLFSFGQIFGASIPYLLLKISPSLYEESEDSLKHLMLGYIFGGFVTASLGLLASESARKNFTTYFTVSAVGGNLFTLFAPWREFV